MERRQPILQRHSCVQRKHGSMDSCVQQKHGSMERRLLMLGTVAHPFSTASTLSQPIHTAKDDAPCMRGALLHVQIAWS
eukprot:937169-Pelagomonas_calceolata.AAC.2